MDASLMSCLLCLISISVFIHVNFILKLCAMILTALAQGLIYACYIRTGEEEEQQQQQQDDDDYG